MRTANVRRIGLTGDGSASAKQNAHHCPTYTTIVQLHLVAWPDPGGATVQCDCDETGSYQQKKRLRVSMAANSFCEGKAG